MSLKLKDFATCDAGSANMSSSQIEDCSSDEDVYMPPGEIGKLLKYILILNVQTPAVDRKIKNSNLATQMCPD